MAKQARAVSTQVSDSVEKAEIFKLYPTTLQHIYLLDINDDGQLREVAVVKKWDNGSISYIDVGLLDQTDRQRMVSLVKGLHADKYELFDVMFHQRLGNGLNALEYFSQLTKHKLAPGSNSSTIAGSLATLKPESNTLIGSDFTDPRAGKIDSIA
jgi:hypothetical protein